MVVAAVGSLSRLGGGLLEAGTRMIPFPFPLPPLLPRLVNDIVMEGGGEDRTEVDDDRGMFPRTFDGVIWEEGDDWTINLMSVEMSVFDWLGWSRREGGQIVGWVVVRLTRRRRVVSRSVLGGSDD